jgi:hypothetical protein
MAGDGSENGAKDYIEAEGHVELADTPTETAFRVCQRGHHYAGNHERNSRIPALSPAPQRSSTVVDTEGHLRSRISELGFIWQGQLRNEPIIRVNSQLI